MIAVSDAVLVLVSATALVAGLYRWQNNLEYVPERAPTAQSSSSVNALPNNTNSGVSTSTTATDNNQSTAAQSNQVTTELGTGTGTQADVDTSRVVDVQSEQTRSIDANQDGETSATDPAIADATSFATYIIVPGDNLSRIAQRFGTSISVLQELNGIQGTLIQVGQRIRYPLPAN